MKRLILMLCISIIFLFSCDQEETSEFPEFPMTSWDMTMEEVMKEYGVNENDTVNYIENLIFEIAGHDIFGETSSSISFRFSTLSEDDNSSLYSVIVEYPEDADMQMVLKRMEKIYGDSLPFANFITYYSAILSANSKVLVEYPTNETDHVKVWSSGPIKGNIPKGMEKQYKEIWEKYLKPVQLEENWDKFLSEGSLVTLGWTDKNKLGSWATVTNPYNRLYFDATSLKLFEHIQEELNP